MKKLPAILLSAIFLFAACTGNKSARQSDTEETGELQQLRLGAMSSMDYIPFVVADKMGIYDSLGLDLTIVKFFSANDRDAAFQSGNIDGTIIDLTGAIIQQANGIDLKIISRNDGFFYLIAGKNTGIEHIAQLKGENVAVSRNTVIEFSTDKTLEAAGLQPSEVNKPEINKIPLRLEMLQNGQIDASIFPDPFATIAEHNGHKPLLTTKELNISVTGTIFTGKALNEKRKEIEVLVKGYNLGVDYLKSHRISEWANILIEDAGFPPALTEKVTLPDYEYAAPPSHRDIEQTIKWLKNKLLIPEDYTGEQLIDAGFTKKR